MSHFVGTLILELYIPEAHSLKEKRSIIKSVISRTRARFNVTVAEVGYQDVWQSAELAIAVVSGSRSEVDRLLESILAFVQSSVSGEITSAHKEIL